MPKRGLVCVFSFLSRKSLEIRKWLQNAIEITLLNCKLKVIYKSPSKIANHFHFKNWKLRFGFVYSFKCNNCNAIYYGKKTKKTKKCYFYVRQLNLCEFRIWQTNVLKMLSNQLFQVTCWLVTATWTLMISPFCLKILIISIYLWRKAY